ncbi:Glycosyltransferase, GT2 family [Fibrobacter sp. UWH9]|uniref:glycosyltransferase family 2 protein n=1 Tax=Fibrobacter sp. UWH9 TaxID=1896213 RepID=UPI000914B4A7|nr:glycosyltransferase family 2 protein [Fibrobacter sp. UWH9]SHH27745.1 Glycosyltransferase, GT2 family [Fibrobacter sp. UWH9]
MFDILVLNYNDSSTTINFVKSVKEYACVEHILIVDNKSTDDSFHRLTSFKLGKIDVVQCEKNGGYGAGNNFGIRYLRENYKSDYILLCNPDVLIDEQTCNEMEIFLRNYSDYAIVAPFMLDSSKKKMYNTAFRIPSVYEYVMSLEMIFSKFFKPFYYSKMELDNVTCKDVGAVSGSLFMMNVAHMLQYGMYDERIFLYCEEMVLGLKLKKAGLKTALLPNLSFVHNHSVSISKSFKTLLSRHRLFMSSKLFVVKEYFKADKLVLFIAHILSWISLLEVRLISSMRGVK